MATKAGGELQRIDDLSERPHEVHRLGQPTSSAVESGCFAGNVESGYLQWYQKSLAALSLWAYPERPPRMIIVLQATSGTVTKLELQVTRYAERSNTNIANDHFHSGIFLLPIDLHRTVLRSKVKRVSKL